MLSLWANWLVTKFGLNSLKRYLWPVLYVYIMSQEIKACASKFKQQLQWNKSAKRAYIMLNLNYGTPSAPINHSQHFFVSGYHISSVNIPIKNASNVLSELPIWWMLHICTRVLTKMWQSVHVWHQSVIHKVHVAIKAFIRHCCSGAVLGAKRWCI